MEKISCIQGLHLQNSSWLVSTGTLSSTIPLIALFLLALKQVFACVAGMGEA
jgi:hypothetical protein